MFSIIVLKALIFPPRHTIAIALVHKNYIFDKSHKAAMYSFFATCEINQIFQIVFTGCLLFLTKKHTLWKRFNYSTVIIICVPSKLD